LLPLLLLGGKDCVGRLAPEIIAPGKSGRHPRDHQNCDKRKDEVIVETFHGVLIFI
jgi:hypothetical protein